MVASAQQRVSHRIRTGPKTAESDEISPGVVMPFPDKVLGMVHSYRFATGCLNRSEAMRDLIGRALAAWRDGRRPRMERFEVEPMPPRAELGKETRLLLRLPVEMTEGVEDFQHRTRRKTRLRAVHDLLWTGLVLWKAQQPAAAVEIAASTAA